MRDPRSRELIREVNKSWDLIPNLTLFSLRYVQEDDADIRQFLEFAVEKMQSLFFNNHVLSEFRVSKIDIGNYMESIINVLPKVSKDVYFYYMKINGKQLAR